MGRAKIITSTIALLSIMGCRLMDPGAPVPVEGAKDDVSAISGKWTGRYSSGDTGRHGTIRFTMPQQADTGFGEVEITFSPSLWLAGNASADALEPDPEDEYDVKPCTVLTIRVVRVQRDEVLGAMTPYWDPDCDCRAQTVFKGRVSGDRITGTFALRRESGDRRVLEGEWWVERDS